MWSIITDNNYTQDLILKLDRTQQTTMFRLCTEHCRLQPHLHKTAQTDQRTCQKGNQTL
uniref:Uncharacterized protein n=1 Tax=Arion vulgaris TaxID=1028688 RepID=A0A0B7A4X2_9EUPU